MKVLSGGDQRYHRIIHILNKMSEFTLFIPKITPESRYVISGPDCQILTINVPPGGTIESEPGAM